MSKIPPASDHAPASGAAFVRGPSSEQSIGEVLEARASAHGERPAVHDGGQEVDYRTLLARADAIATLIRRRGVVPGSLVGVCVGRSWELVAAVVGVLRAGCGYVPLDPDYPAERLQFMVEHAGARLVLVADDDAAERCPVAVTVLRLTEATGADAPDVGADDPSADGDARHDAPAYVIYTSGSEGEPKGVAVGHRSVLAMAAAMADLLDEEDLSGVLAAASICFDPSVMEILGTLLLGGTVVLAPDALALPDLPAVGRVRTTIGVPSAMRALLRAGGLPEGVRSVVLGGEVLTGDLVGQLRSRPSPPRVVNVYGPTEATVFATASVVGPESEPITIGRPVAGVRAYVVDPVLEPVADGETGELCLAGDQLAQGYLHDEARTRERFPTPGAGSLAREQRVYRTGDLCRRTAAGELEFLGRTDRQVKLRGYRIELDEVETALASAPGVDEAAAVVTQTEGERTELVGFVAALVAPPSDPAVRAHLASRLPRFMVPHRLVRLPRLPRLPNGKLDRHALTTPAAPGSRANRPSGATTGVDDGADRHPVHETVRGEVATLLGLPGPASVPAGETLESLGLDSLDVAELTVRLGHVLDLALPTSTLCQQDTSAEAARAVLSVASAPAGTDGPQVAIDTARRDRLTVFQQQIKLGHPPSFAATLPAWSASDRGVLVRHLRAMLSREGLDPYGKVVRTGSAERGVVVDVNTGEERESIIWTTNLYLGLNRDDAVIAEARSAVERFGTGMGISAAGSGQTDLHLAFEREFATMVGKTSACLFPTGFTASLGAVSGIVGEGDVVVMDQLCHASLVDGARLSRARVRTFRHDDVEDLERVLEEECSPYRTTLVVLESVYSMGEGAAPVRTIARAAKRHGALVAVDEAHSFGLYGPKGAGLCAAEGVTDEVDLVMTTLSKALGSIGGVVAGNEDHIALLRTSARSYVFQANVSPADIAAALAALRQVAESDERRARLWDTAGYLRRRLVETGHDLGAGEGLIVTPHVADGTRLRAIARGLYRRGVHTAAVAYPIVERDRGRLRFICSASHTRSDVDATIEALAEAEAEAGAAAEAGAGAATAEAAVSPGGERPPTPHRAGSGVGSCRAVLEWADALVAHLEHTISAQPAQPPSVLVVIEPPGGPEVRLRVGEHGSVDRSEGRPGDRPGDGPEVGTDASLPRCALRLHDEAAVEALCSDDPARLLGSVVDGSCAVTGDAEPFVWLVGRLSEARSAPVG